MRGEAQMTAKLLITVEDCLKSGEMASGAVIKKWRSRGRRMMTYRNFSYVTYDMD